MFKRFFIVGMTSVTLLGCSTQADDNSTATSHDMTLKHVSCYVDSINGDGTFNCLDNDNNKIIVYNKDENIILGDSLELVLNGFDEVIFQYK